MSQINQINIEIHNAILHNDIDMLHFILENIIRNNNIEAFNDLIVELTYNRMYDFFVYAINSINLNEIYVDYDTLSMNTIATNYINWIMNEIIGNGDNPEIYRPYINAIFDNYIDMNKGDMSMNDLLEITDSGITNSVENIIRNMINDKISEENMYRQSKSFVSGLNPTLSMDSPLNFLDIDTMKELYSSMILPKPDIEKKIMDEYKLDPLVKAKQKLAFAKGFSDPNSSIRIREDHLRDDIGNLVSRHRPYPSVQKRFMLENKPKTKKSKKFAKRTKKNRKKRNRF
jgi:hypothetical protein